MIELSIVLVFLQAVFCHRFWWTIIRAQQNFASLEKIRCSPSYNIPPSSDFDKVWIILPLYREAALVNQIKEAVYSLCKYEHVSLLMVTSDRPEELLEIHTTRDALDLAEWPSNCTHLHFDRPIRGKGALINESLKEIDVTPADWVGIYDADSLPDDKIISYLGSRGANTLIVQQPTIYSKNIISLSTPMKYQAIFQTAWSFGVEVDRLRSLGNSADGPRKNCIPRFCYLVGHGIYLRGEYLEKLDWTLWDEFEDLGFAYHLCLDPHRVDIAPYYDRSSFVIEFGPWIRQSRNWASGCWCVFERAWSDRNRYTGAQKKRMSGLWFASGINSLAWAFEGLLLPLLLIVALLLNHPMIWTLFLVQVLIQLLCGRALFNFSEQLDFSAKKREAPMRTVCGLFFLVLPTLRSIGPLLALFALILGRKSVDEYHDYGRTEKDI